MEKRRWHGWDFAPALLGAVAFLVYAFTRARSVSWGDSGEFLTAVGCLGISHPTGYPLYLLLARAFALLPAGEFAARISLFSAVCGGVAIGLTAAAARRLVAGGPSPCPLPEYQARVDREGDLLVSTPSPYPLPSREREYGVIAAVGAVAAAGVLAFSPMCWELAGEAEVYALHLALIAGAFFFLLRWRQEGDRRNLYSSLFLLALAVAHHRAAFFLLPGFLLLIGSAAKRRQLRLGQWVGPLLLFGVLAAATFLYLPIRAAAHPPLNWGNPQSWKQFWWCITGGQFKLLMWGGDPRAGGVGLLNAYREGGLWYLKETWRQFGVLFLPLLWGVLRGLRHWRAEALALLLYWVLLLLVLLPYRIGDLDQQFLTLHWILAFFLAEGLADLLQQVWQRSRRSLAVALCGAVLLLPVMNLRLHWRENDRRFDTSAAEYARHVLDKVGPQGMFLASSDNDIFPLWYAQWVAKRWGQPAVAGTNFLSFAWYGDMLRWQGLEVAVPEYLSQSREEWLETVWRLLLAPGVHAGPVYSSEPFTYLRWTRYGVFPTTDNVWQPDLVWPSWEWWPRREQLTYPVAHVSAEYAPYLPAPFIYQLLPAAQPLAPRLSFAGDTIWWAVPEQVTSGEVLGD